MKHSKNNPQSKIYIVGIILWILALIFEGGASFVIFLIQSGQLPGQAVVFAFLIHIAASLFFFYFLTLPYVKGRQNIRYFAFLGGLLTFFFPLIGIVGFSFILLFVTKLFKKRGIIEDYQESTSHYIEEKILFDTEMDLDTFLNDELSIEPILDILRGDDENFKRGAVNYLSHIGTPKAIVLLKKCLNDPSPDVQLYAQFALAKLDENHSRRIKEAKSLVESGSGEKSEYLRQLGDAYKNYAESGLPEANAKIHYLGIAKQAFIEMLSNALENHEILLTLAQICMDRKEYKDAEKFFNKFIETTGETHEAMLGLCQIYYEKRNLKALRETIKQMDLIKKFDSAAPYKTILYQFWANSQEA